MLRIFILLISAIFVLTSSSAQEAYHIEIKLDNYKNDTLLLGYYMGDKQFVKDTAFRKDDKFIFEGSMALDPGVYMVVLLPSKNVFQFLIDQNNHHMYLHANALNLNDKISVENSQENKIFFEYIHFLSTQKPRGDELHKLAGQTSDPDEKAQVNKLITKLDEKVFAKQDEFVAKYPQSFTAALIKSSKDVKTPEFKEDEPVEAKLQKYVAYKSAYLSNLDFADERLFRSPIYFQKIDAFVQQITVQNPDSIIASLDFILDKTRVLDDAFQFYLSHYFNHYLRSKFVGMDAVYVHLIDKYYAAGQAPWVDPENLQKMKDAAEDIRPTLIGRKAPNLTFLRQDGSPIKVHDIKSDYTILFFWAPDCSHCEKAIPVVKDFYTKFKPKGVEILSICTGLLEEANNCWSSIEKKEIQAFVNVNDPQLRSNFKVWYNIKTTPQFFVLDKDKKIISKGIGAEQLESVMGQIIDHDRSQKL